MFVMLAHLESTTKGLVTFLTPFALTAFFFLAGYVYKQPAFFKELFVKKTKGLVVPWFVLSNVSIGMSAIMSFKSDHNLLHDLLWNLFQIRERGAVMWFVPALYVAFMPFFLCLKLINRKKSLHCPCFFQ